MEDEIETRDESYRDEDMAMQDRDVNAVLTFFRLPNEGAKASEKPLNCREPWSG